MNFRVLNISIVKLLELLDGYNNAVKLEEKSIILEKEKERIHLITGIHLSVDRAGKRFQEKIICITFTYIQLNKQI